MRCGFQFYLKDSMQDREEDGCIIGYGSIICKGIKNRRLGEQTVADGR